MKARKFSYLYWNLSSPSESSKGKAWYAGYLPQLQYSHIRVGVSWLGPAIFLLSSSSCYMRIRFWSPMMIEIVEREPRRGGCWAPGDLDSSIQMLKWWLPRNSGVKEVHVRKAVFHDWEFNYFPYPLLLSGAETSKKQFWYSGSLCKQLKGPLKHHIQVFACDSYLLKMLWKWKSIVSDVNGQRIVGSNLLDVDHTS